MRSLSTILLAACVLPQTTGEDTNTSPSGGTVLIVSLDGFRADYPGRADTPNLDRIAASGVHAEGLIPAFPSKTFPNHYTIVTGLYPEHHGIVSNYFYDPDFDAQFGMMDDDSNSNGRWWLGEPIWVTAERQGVTSATCMWTGSEAEIGGYRPSYWVPYGALDYAGRIEQVVDWLGLPDDRRPQLLTLYFDEPDGVGHATGPEGTEVEHTVETMDGWIGTLLNRLEEEHQLDDLHIIIVSDHGMSQLSPDRLVFLDDYIDTWGVPIESWGPLAAIRPEGEEIDTVVAQLQGAEHMTCGRKQDLPEHLHYADSRRIAPVQCVAEDGWSITTRGYFALEPNAYDGGTHGYDPQDQSMHGIFYAMGPRMKAGETVDRFENVHIYNLLADLIGVDPAENDGTPGALEHLLTD